MKRTRAENEWWQKQARELEHSTLVAMAEIASTWGRENRRRKVEALPDTMQSAVKKRLIEWWRFKSESGKR